MVIKIKLFSKRLYFDYTNLLTIYLLFLYIYMLRTKANPSIQSFIANYDTLFVLCYTLLIIVLLNVKAIATYIDITVGKPNILHIKNPINEVNIT